jgi:hypothetical protein
VSNKDLARGRALALHIMGELDEELAQTEALVGAPLEAARRPRDAWRAREEPGDLFLNAEALEVFTAELSMARSLHHGASFQPCPFDPYHESATTRVLWRPPGGVPRPVTCCRSDAALIGAGAAPAARLVPSLKGKVPLWEGDDLHARWLMGHHAATGAASLPDVFRGTPLGHWLNAMRGR